MADHEGTIAALATAPMPSGVAVIRVSGPKTKLALHALFRGNKDPVHFPRTLVFGEIVDFLTGHTIDKALGVFMPSPWSYTGEDVAEFQFHGSPVLVQKILSSIYAFGVSPANPGEFTKRAFLNGKMDLAQAEAIADLINAKSEEALKIAGEQLEGRFSKAISDIGEPLRNTLAELEAYIDFPEEDIEPDSLSVIRNQMLLAQNRIDGLLKTYSFGQLVKEGMRVLICGRPNAGKSSILNLLLGRNRAIVSNVAGTTRDLLEEEAVISGYKFVFCDSAGIHDTNDVVEKMGVELAVSRIEWADLILLVVDASDREQRWKDVLEFLKGKAKRLWMVTNKVDLNPNSFSEFFCESPTCQQNFYLSAKTQDGFDSLVNSLVEEVVQSGRDTSEAGEILTNERHKSCLTIARDSIENALAGLDSGNPLEIICADLREGLGKLDEIIGKTYTEDILGRIFSKFCIGK